MAKTISKREEQITHQLTLIDTINEMINIAKKGNDSLGVRQYEHLKKQYVNNLYKMLAENYQIPIPTLVEAA